MTANHEKTNLITRLQIKDSNIPRPAARPQMAPIFFSWSPVISSWIMNVPWSLFNLLVFIIMLETIFVTVIENKIYLVLDNSSDEQTERDYEVNHKQDQPKNIAVWATAHNNRILGEVSRFASLHLLYNVKISLSPWVSFFSTFLEKSCSSENEANLDMSGRKKQKKMCGSSGRAGLQQFLACIRTNTIKNSK